MRGKGRPRDARLDEAIIEAAAELLVRDGFAALTIDAVARAAGTTRPAVYRRYAGRVELTVAVLGHRFGLAPVPDTGSLRGDLTALQAHQREMFRDPLMQAAMLGVLADVRADPQLLAAVQTRFLTPRRAQTKDMVDRAVARGEIPAGADAELLNDLVTGPLLFRAILPSLGDIDDKLLAATVTVGLACAAGQL